MVVVRYTIAAFCGAALLLALGAAAPAQDEDKPPKPDRKAGRKAPGGRDADAERPPRPDTEGRGPGTFRGGRTPARPPGGPGGPGMRRPGGPGMFRPSDSGGPGGPGGPGMLRPEGPGGAGQHGARARFGHLRWPHHNWESLEQRDPEMYKLLKADHDLERQTRELAVQYRQAPDDEKSSIEKQMKEVVDKHFQVRQDRRRLELKRLEEELKRLRDSFEQRNKAREGIVEKRVSQLLGEDAPGF